MDLNNRNANNIIDGEDTPRIGKDVLESLTLGMYEDCRFMYREYIQNSADQIDKAVNMGLMSKEDGEIHITIDFAGRKIMVEDNATGIPQDEVVSTLRNVAHSSKRRGTEKGFRGIGRLGGLGYCTTLRFETSYSGEPIASVMTWDGSLFKKIINNRDEDEEATEVLKRITNITRQKEDPSKHYFRVIMEGVTSEELLNIDKVREYLSMVAPVDIDSRFAFRNDIRRFMKSNNLSIDTYNVYINGDQIYKPYTTSIYEDGKDGRKIIDQVSSVKFLLQKDEENNILYWGWYSNSSFLGQIKPTNIARGIRLRKENIQIGDEEICKKKFFDKTDDQRFSFYFFGEIHAVGKELIPNSRRDYFGETEMCALFERRIKEDFLKLKELCSDVSKIRSKVKAIKKVEDTQTKIEEKKKTGYVSKQEEEQDLKMFEKLKSEAEKARRELENMHQKSSNPDLKGFFEHAFSSMSKAPQIPSSNVVQEDLFATSVSTKSSTPSPTKTKYRTDKACYSHFSSKEKELISKIYSSIINSIADERQREALISKIEEDITK